MLTKLQEGILQRQEAISRLKLRTRTLSVHTILLAVVIYGGLLVYHFVGRRRRSLSWGLGLFVYPFAVYCLKRGIVRISALLIDKHQRILATLQTQQAKQLEELKEATGYNRTKSILDKYACTAETAPLPLPADAKSQLILRKRPKAPKDPVHSPKAPQTLIHNGKPGARASPKGFPLLLPPASPSYQQPNWVDRLMDSLIGDDSRNQKFALICQNCFNHNGLLPPEFFPQARYRCPNCGFFNDNAQDTRHSVLTASSRICEVEAESVEVKEDGDAKGNARGKGKLKRSMDEIRDTSECKDDAESSITQETAE
jgi:hypothetical protein